jgi:hypothetical protein
MHVQVKDRLSGPRANIEHRAVPLLNVSLSGNVRGRQVAPPDDFGVIGLGLFQSGKMFLRDNQNVRGRLRADVLKSENVFVFINLFRGNLALKNAAKQAISVAHE